MWAAGAHVAEWLPARGPGPLSGEWKGRRRPLRSGRGVTPGLGPLVALPHSVPRANSGLRPRNRYLVIKNLN